MENWEAQIVIKHMGDPMERNVGMLLLDAGLELVATHVPVSPEGNEDGDVGEEDRSRNLGEIDLLFKHGETAFIVEVSVQRERGKKLKNFFDVFSKREVLDRLRGNEDYGRDMDGIRRFKRVYFDMRHPHNEKELGDIMEPIREEGNHIVYKDEFDRVQAWIRKKSTDRFLEIALSREGSSAIQVPNDG